MAMSSMRGTCLSMTFVYLGVLSLGQAVHASPHSASVAGSDPIKPAMYQGTPEVMSQSIKQAIKQVVSPSTEQIIRVQQRQDEADKAFYYWLHHQPNAYQFELTIHCWCDFSGQYIFEVVNGEPVTNSANPAWLHNQWGVMEGVFDRIQEAMDWQYQTIDVDYHQEHFYPTRIHFFDHQFDQLTYLNAEIRLLTQ